MLKTQTTLQFLWNKARADTSKCGKEQIHVNTLLLWQRSQGLDWGGGVQAQLEKHIQSITGRKGIPWTVMRSNGSREFLDLDDSYEPQTPGL